MRFLTLAIALFTGLALAAPTEQTESVGLERRQMMNQRTCVPANCAHCIVSKVETYLPQSVLDKQAARRAAVNPGEIPKPIEYTGYERELVRRAVLVSCYGSCAVSFLVSP
ncbi:MAG: hypothetical protein M1823_004521 [Watsoniomyces obsoletus]|nr:MAG: hypothetical protein M1823_004521 [Watsoniomyces obsoletus]